MRISKKSKDIGAFLKKQLPDKKVLIALHDNPDPDCLASGLCLKKLFEDVYHVTSTMAYNGMLGRAENRAMVAECGIDLVHRRNIRLDDYSFVAMVDCQPGAGNNFISLDRLPQMVVDHHPRRTTTRNIPWVDIRLKAGTSCTIAMEYLLAHHIDLSGNEACAVFYAIKSETQDLGRESSPMDKRAYFHLFPKVDFELLYRITHAEVGKEYFIALFRALENAKIHNDVLITSLGVIDQPDHVAETADWLLRLKKVRWTMVTGKHKEMKYLSIRTSYRDVDAGEVMQTLVEGLGTGGGHEMIAGGRIDLSVAPISENEVVRILSTRFLQTLHKRSPGSGLVED